jgi:alanyl-tRNA synthetase
MWLIIENARLRDRVEIAQAEQTKAAQAAQQARQQAEEQRSQNEQLTAELADQQQQIEQLAKEQQRPRPAPLAAPSMSEIASLSLTYRMTRSPGSLASLVLKPETKTALFRLLLEKDEYGSYRAEVRTLEGQTVYSQDGLKARNTDSGPTLILRVPANRLPAGDHTVMVIGVTADGGAEEVTEYYFRVSTPPPK